MNGFMLLSVASSLYFTFYILDQCSSDDAVSLSREQNKRLKYALFKDHLFYALLVPTITTTSFTTGKHCLLQCLKNEKCFSTNIGTFPGPDGNFTCELLPTDKYNASEKFQANHSFHHYSIMVSYYTSLSLLHVNDNVTIFLKFLNSYNITFGFAQREGKATLLLHDSIFETRSF